MNWPKAFFLSVVWGSVAALVALGKAPSETYIAAVVVSIAAFLLEA